MNEHSETCLQIPDKIIGELTPAQRLIKLACPSASHDTVRAWYKGQDPTFEFEYYDFDRRIIVYKKPSKS